MHGWHCYIFKTYPPDKLSKLRTTGPWTVGDVHVEKKNETIGSYAMNAIYACLWMNMHVYNNVYACLWMNMSMHEKY